MGEEIERAHGTTQSGADVTFMVKSTDDPTANTQVYHGYENGPHHTEHKGGDTYYTDGDGNVEKK